MYGAALLSKSQEDTGVLGPTAAEANAAREKPAGAPGIVIKEAKPAAPQQPADDDGDDDDEDDEEGEDGDEEDEDADPSDLQLAWENLDMARLIYGNHPGYDEQLAQVHVKLGEVMMEEEQFEKALQDFDNAHTLFLRLTPVPLRRIASLLYNASYALTELQRPAEALERFRQAVASFRSRLDELRATTDEGAAHPEAVEIQATMEEMLIREAELRESAAEEHRAKEAIKALFTNMAAGPSSGAGPSHGAGSSAAAASSAAPAAFDAPRMASAHNLGVVGRGVSRITPMPASAAAGPASTPAPGPAPRRFVPEPVAWPAAGAGPSSAPVAVAVPVAPKRPADPVPSAETAAKVPKQDEASGECKQQ